MTILEIPIPPGPRIPEARVEPPRVAVEPRWEYKTVVREVTSGPMSETELNELGAAHWELVGIVEVSTRIHFYFKREQGL